MVSYYAEKNKDSQGHHHVHREDCALLPKRSQYLGTHPSCKEALRAARLFYVHVNGCKICIPDCYEK